MSNSFDQQDETDVLQRAKTAGTQRGDETAVMYERPDHANWNLSMLDTMRRERTLCDVVLCVDQSTNLYAHQVMLACHSPFLMNIFQRAAASKSGSVNEELASVSANHKGLYCRLSNCFDADAVKHLLDYMYSGSIWIGEENACNLYTTAVKLSVTPVVNACAQYLKERVNPLNVIGILKLPTNEELKQLALGTVKSCYKEVVETKAFKELPHLVAEIRGQPLHIKCSNQLACCVMSHLVAYYKNQDNSLADFAESTHRIYIDGRSQRGSLKVSSDDEAEAPTICGPHFIDYDVSRDDFMQCDQNHSIATRKSSNASQTTPNPDLEILYVFATRASHLSGLASVDGEIAAFTITVKSIIHSDKLSVSDADLSSTAEGGFANTASSREGRRRVCERIAQINSEKVCLSQPRAGLALIICEDKLLAVGGFNSGACLDSVEAYSPSSNAWERWPPMKGRRGRCFAAKIFGQVGVLGGSDGSHHLTDAEILDVNSRSWSIVPGFKLPSQHSVVVVGEDEEIYSICGTHNGEASPFSYKYSFANKSWNQISPLKHERSNPTALWHHGSLYVFGGNATWRCLRTCEVYRPESDSWVDLPDMLEPRRSAGIASYNGKIYLIGGTDGSVTMSAVDIFDPNAMQWEKGPELKYRRSSPGVAIKDGLIYVVGGFDGQSFQRTTEVFDGSKWSVLQNIDETEPIEEENEVISVFDPLNCKP